MAKITKIIVMLLLLMVTSASAYEFLRIEEGENKTFSQGARTWNFSVTTIRDGYTLLKLDDFTSDKIYEDDEYRFPDGTYIIMNSVLSSTATTDLIEFNFTWCGNCSDSQICHIYKCTNIVCGDGECHDSETCKKDNCCNGNIKNFTNDFYNCDGCGNVCDSGETCTNGDCVEKCGNGICDSDETCTWCEEDCGDCPLCGNDICEWTETCSNCSDCVCNTTTECSNGVCTGFCGNNICETGESCSNCGDCFCEEGKKCIGGKCTSFCGNNICEDDENCECSDCLCEKNEACIEKECISNSCNDNSECIDNNPCTADICQGTPKVCTNEKTPGCILNNECLKHGEQREEVYCSIQGKIGNTKNNNDECKYNYECQNNLCDNNKCSKLTPFRRLVLWFRKLIFG